MLGPYALTQTDDCFPLGGDALLLGRFATVKNRWRVCDLGCGSGILGLLLCTRAENLSLTGVELNPAAAEVARQNFRGNGLNASVLSGDLRDCALPAGQFDLVVSNPPWFPRGSGKPGGSARMEEHCTLAEVCAAAGRILKNGGRFALVHRPERLAEVFFALGAVGLEPKRLQLVQHNGAAPPSAVLVEAVRQGRPGLTVLPVLIRDENGPALGTHKTPGPSPIA